MRLHLFGDSVFRGLVTDISDNPAESLRPLRTPAAIMNLVAGRELARFAGFTGIPKDVPGATEAMAAIMASDAIADGDMVAFLDVGPHAMDTARHEAGWLLLRRAATGTRRVRLLMCSGFDYGARGRRDLQHEAELDGRSPNDAVRAAAQAPGQFLGVTQFLDIAGPLKRLHGTLRARFGVSPYFRDCVHLNVWGQIFLSLLILRQLNLAMPKLGRLAAAVAVNLRHLDVATQAKALAVLNALAEAAGVRSPALRLALMRIRLNHKVHRVLGGLFPNLAEPVHEPGAEVLAQVGQAAVLMGERDFEAALAVYRAALLADPKCRPAHNGRVHAAALAGHHEEVIEGGRAALAFAPEQAKYYVWIAEAMLAQGADPALVAWLDETAESHAPPRAFRAMARLTAAMGDPDRARIWQERADFEN